MAQTSTAAGQQVTSLRQPRAPRVISLRNPADRKRVEEGKAKRCDRATKWGNPFIVGKDGTRDEVIAKHKAWFSTAFSDAEVQELRGWDLACWCAPLSCHCDVILERANRAGA